MIFSTAINKQILGVKAPVVFEKDNQRTRASVGVRGWLRHGKTSPNFVLTKPGYYKITYHADVSSQDPTLVSLAIAQGDTVIDGSESSTTIAQINDYGNVSGNIFVFVPYYANLEFSLVNTSEMEIITRNVSLTIDKVA